MPREDIEIHRRLIETINDDDLESELELIHPDLELFPREDEPEAGVHHGREGYLEYIRFFDEVFADYRLEVEEYVEVGDYLLVIARAGGTARGSGVPLENVAGFDRPVVWLWRFRDGMGIERREYRTRAEALEAAARLQR